MRHLSSEVGMLSRTMTPPEADHSYLSHWDAWLKKQLRRFVADAHLAQDVSQDVWLVRLQRTVGVEPTGPAWLIGAARNIFRRRLESDSRRRRREFAAARSAPAVSPRESAGIRADVDDLRRALDRLDPLLFEAVRLRWFEGLGPKDAAARLGISVEAFRARLKRAHAKLREALRQDSDHSKNFAVLPIGHLDSGAEDDGFAEPEPVVEVASTSSAFCNCLAGFAAGAILLAAAVALPRFFDEAPRTPSPAVAAAAPAERRSESPRGAPRRFPVVPSVESGAPSEPRLAANASTDVKGSESTSADPTDGMLRVRLVSAVDGSPLPGVRIRFEPGVKNKVHAFPDAVSGADGFCEPVRLAPGSWGVNTGRTSSFGVVRLPAGRLSDYVVRVPKGVDLFGVVTDEYGRPIAHAEVIHSLSNAHFAGPHIAATTDADGRFVLPDVVPGESVVVRAAGFARSRPAPVPFDIESERLEFRLSHQAGAVEGRIVDGNGEPIAGAMVHVGESLSRYFAARRRVFSDPAMAGATRSDADGRFRLPWVEAGAHVLTVHHRAYLTHEANVQVATGLANYVLVSLQRGSVVSGRIGLDHGGPMPGVAVSVFGEGDIEARYDITDAEGRYEVDGVGAGRRHTRAHIAGRAAITGTIDVPSAGRAVWNADFPERMAVEGRVSDPDGSIPKRIVMLSLFEILGEGPKRFVASALLVEGRFYLEVPPGSAGRFELEIDDAQGVIQCLDGVQVGDPNLSITLAR